MDRFKVYNPKVKYIVDSNGKKTDVIIPLAEYHRLIEDLHDLAVIAERRDEETIPLAEVKRQLAFDKKPD